MADDQAGGAVVASAVPPAHGDTSTGDQPQGESEVADPEEAATVSLLGAEKYNAVKDDPKKLAKALHQSYTQKTQRLSQHESFIREWQDDPEAVIEKMATQFGMSVSKQPNAPPIQDQVREGLAGIFGDEAANALTTHVSALVERIVDEKTRPQQEDLEDLTNERALAKADALLERMTAKYPDWKQFDAEMEALGKRLLPNGMDDFEYMELLYDKVKSKAAVADKAGKVIDRMQTSVKNAEKPTQGIHPGRVASVPISANGRLRFEDAWAAAKRGEVLDPDEIRRAKRAAGH